MSKLDDVLALLVFLTGLECLLVFPSQCGLATITVNISHGVKTRQQDPLFSRAASDIHNGVEQVGPPLTALEGFGDELIVIGQMGSAMYTRICPMTGGQVCSECLESLVSGFLGHGYHHMVRSTVPAIGDTHTTSSHGLTGYRGLENGQLLLLRVVVLVWSPRVGCVVVGSAVRIATPSGL